MYSGLLRNPQPNSPQPPPTTGVGRQPISRADFPWINYWTQKDWTAHKASIQQGGITSSDDLPDAAVLDFIESEEGVTVSHERIAAIRRSSRELFVSLRMKYERNQRAVPKNWGSMNHGDKEFHREKIKEQYPELVLCEADWKSEQVATQTYSGWYRTHVKPKVKQEPGAKRRSKAATGSSGSPTPAPENAPSRISPTGPTPESGASPVMPAVDLGLNPFGLDSQPVDYRDVSEPLQDPNPTQNPALPLKSPSSQSLSPESSTTSPVPTDAPFGTTNCSLGGSPPLDAEVVVPTAIRPLEREATPSALIQVCPLFLFSTALHQPFALVSRSRTRCTSPPPTCEAQTLTLSTAPRLISMSCDMPRHRANHLHAVRRKRREMTRQNAFGFEPRNLLPLGMFPPPIIFSSRPSLAIRNLYMIEYLEHSPDTTTAEFDQVWRGLDPETRYVCPPVPNITLPPHPISGLGAEEQGGEVSYSRHRMI